MNIDTGELISDEQMKKLMSKDPEKAKRYKQVEHATPLQLKRKNVHRNEPCPCGSGKKFKKCCWANAKVNIK